MLLQIERVDQVAQPVAKPNYTIYEFMCSGWVEGEYVAQIKVQTLSGKEADYVQPGWAGQVTVDEKFGIHYKIQTPGDGVDGQGKAQGLQPVRNSKQAQAPNPAPAQGAPPPPPRTGAQPQRGAPPVQGKKVAFMDLIDGYTTCMQTAEFITKSQGYSFPDCISFDDLHSVASTLFIQAQRGGVKIPAPRVAGAKPEQRAEQPPPPAPELPPQQPEVVEEDEDLDNMPF